MMEKFNCIYLIVAFAVSAFYGLFAVIIFFGTDHYKSLPLSKKIREAIFNFSGTAVGFSVFYYLVRKAVFSVSQTQYNLMNLTDVLLLMIAVTGIFGLLPWTIHTIASRIDTILSGERKKGQGTLE